MQESKATFITALNGFVELKDESVAENINAKSASLIQSRVAGDILCQEEIEVGFSHVGGFCKSASINANRSTLQDCEALWTISLCNSKAKNIKSHGGFIILEISSKAYRIEAKGDVNVRSSSVNDFCRSDGKIDARNSTIKEAACYECEAVRCDIKKLTASKVKATDSTIGDLRILTQDSACDIDLTGTRVTGKITIEADLAPDDSVNIRFINGIISRKQVEFVDCDGDISFVQR